MTVAEAAERTAADERQRQLPAGWRWVRLGDACHVIMGQSPVGSSYNQGREGEPLLNGPTEFGERYPNPVQWTTEPTKFAAPDDILFCVRGATTGRKNIADRRYCIGRGLAAVRAKTDQLASEFLWFALDAITASILKETAGSTFPNLPSEKLERCLLPLPPLPEQKRIAAILTAQMAAVARARAAAEVQLAAARALPAAYLRAVFESAEARGWLVVPLREVGDIGAGITLGRKLDGIETSTVPYLRVANVKDGYLDLSDVYTTRATAADLEKCRLEYGDLLLTEGGDPDKLGRGTFWEGQIPGCLHQNHIFRVRFDRRKFSPPFLAAQIGSPYGKAYFLAHAKQTTGIATINQKVLGAFPLMVPPLAEQERIAMQLAGEASKTEQVRQALEAQLAAINALPAALLGQAIPI